MVQWTSNGYTIRYTKPQKLSLDNVNCSFKGLGDKWYE